jgi:SSS family solute:Na+ symporter
MWWAGTSALEGGGAGAAIIGGLYWKKGTTAGAWASLATGSTLSVGGIIARQIYGDGFPLNGVQIGFYVAVLASMVYIVVSLLTCRGDFDMDRMLHRGEYASQRPPEEVAGAQPAKKIGWLRKITGINEDFTTGDKWIAGSLVGWGLLWFAVFLVGTLWNLIAPWPVSVWSGYYHIVAIGIPCIIAPVTAVWFTWGGLRDLFDLFRKLQNFKANDLDDGTVVGHQNLVDAVGPAEGKVEEAEVRG